MVINIGILTSLVTLAGCSSAENRAGGVGRAHAAPLVGFCEKCANGTGATSWNTGVKSDIVQVWQRERDNDLCWTECSQELKYAKKVLHPLDEVHRGQWRNSPSL